MTRIRVATNLDRENIREVNLQAFPEGENQVVSELAVNLLGDPFIHIMAQDQLLRVSAASFFYPSPPGLSLLIEQLLKYAALTGDEHIWDLYSGVGTLSLFLAPHAKSIIGVESNPDSIADAAANLDDFEHISLYEGPVEHVLPL